MRGSARSLIAIVFVTVATVALPAPAGAGAANVVNGNFETGNLQGWNVHRALEAGNWFAYRGIDEPYVIKRSPSPPQPPVDPPQEPPQGTYAAVADEINPDTLILSQDVALAGRSERNGSACSPTTTPRLRSRSPAPDTLSVDKRSPRRAEEPAISD